MDEVPVGQSALWTGLCSLNIFLTDFDDNGQMLSCSHFCDEVIDTAECS